MSKIQQRDLQHHQGSHQDPTAYISSHEDSSGNILTEDTDVLNRLNEYCSSLYNYELHSNTSLLQSNRPPHKITNEEGQRDKQGWRRWWRWNKGMQSHRKCGLWQAVSEDVWILEWCEHVKVHGLQDGLHCFGLSEVCRPRTDKTDKFTYIGLFS